MIGVQTMATILIVDDDGQIRALIRQILETAGYRTICAENGREAMELICNQAIDLIVTDILMPEADGVEIILKARFDAKAPPIIAISGGGRYYKAVETLSWARNLGVRYTFQKPIDRKEFIAAVKELVGE